MGRHYGIGLAVALALVLGLAGVAQAVTVRGYNDPSINTLQIDSPASERQDLFVRRFAPLAYGVRSAAPIVEPILDSYFCKRESAAMARCEFLPFRTFVVVYLSHKADRFRTNTKVTKLEAGPGDDDLAGRGRYDGGRGNDRINTVNGKRGDTVDCGPGRDVARIDKGDRALGCESVRVTR